MKKISEREWLEDFQEFVKAGASAAPEKASREILSRVRADLTPAPLGVFAKLLGVHAVVGTGSLALCDQFDMNPFGTSFSLSDYFMKFGHSTCMTLCGLLFIALTVAVGGWLFRPEEIRVFRRSAWLQSLGLAGVSLGMFAAFGAQIALGFGVLWLLGALAGGVGTGRILGYIQTPSV